MGKRDITLKDYLSESRRYADLINGSIFHGRQVVSSEELQDMDRLQSKSDMLAILERTNDIAMKQMKNGSLFAVWVVANQNAVDYSMPVRVMLQDALAYDKQLKALKRGNQIKANQSGIEKFYADSGEFLSQIRRRDRLHPVMTLVVYWGEEKWQGANNLHDIIDFGEDEVLAKELKAVLPEYPIHILDLSQVHDYGNFQSELRIMSELYDRKNNIEEFRNYIEEHEECKEMDNETYWALCVLLNAKELKVRTPQGEGGKTDMCKALQDLLEEGRQEGRIEGRLEALYELVQDGMLSVKDASGKASMTENAFADKMKQWRQECV